jgi:transcriptional regulator with XRE-family HTH domain
MRLVKPGASKSAGRQHRAPEADGTPPGVGQPAIGGVLAGARQRRGWTLAELSKASGVAISTLSKIENGLSGASFDTVSRISRALNLQIDDILEPSSPKFASGRRSITKAGDGVKFGFQHYDYTIPCNDLVSKGMIPLIMTIKSHDLLPGERWASHPGEEYIYILDGAIELHTEFYEPVRLETGDSVYIDSMMKHAFVNLALGDSRMLSICLSRSLKEVFGDRISSDQKRSK